MSHRESLDTRCTKICGVVTLPKDYPSKVLEVKLVDFFNSYNVCVRYYIILHDENEENLHFHYACSLSSQKRLKTFLNDMNNFLALGINYIGVESMRSLSGMLMYFIHANQEHKKEYLVEDIISNDNEEIIFDLIDMKAAEVTTIYLIEMVLRFDHDSDLMKYIGLTTYHKYRNEIKVLRDESFYLNAKYKYLLDKKFDAEGELPF